MSLSSVLQIAQNSLTNISRRTAVTARNISDVGNEDYVRRDIRTTTTANGARVVDPRRATELRLERAALAALSDNSARQLLSTHLTTLHSELGFDQEGGALGDQLTALHDAIQVYSSSPGSTPLGQAVVEKAHTLVATLNGNTRAIQQFRSGVDVEIADTVDELNGLLSEFENVNSRIVQGAAIGGDINDALDRRSALMKDIAAIVPYDAIARSNNDLVLITTSGATLFETVVRPVDFTSTGVLAAGISGQPVLVDVVTLPVGSGPESLSSGKLEALLRLRDDVAPQLQSQMDELARGLMEAFAEMGPTGALAPLAGLFTRSTGPALPASGVALPGLASAIAVNPAFDLGQGGNPALIRDGGANGGTYVENFGGYASFTNRLIALANGFDAARPFDPATEVGGAVTLMGYAEKSATWFEVLKSDIDSAAEGSDALHARLRESLSNATGVDLDQELSLLGELEQGYEASARLLRAIDEMLRRLFDAV